MKDLKEVQEKFRRKFITWLALGISGLFLFMIRGFLMPLFLAAIFAGLSHPVYARVLKLFRGRQVLSSLVTLLILLFVVVLPLLGFLGVVASQALRVSEVVTPWVQERIHEPSEIDSLLPEWIPFLDSLQPYRSQIMSALGNITSKMGQLLVTGLSAATKGTAGFFLSFFVMLYAMFFFLMDGQSMLNRGLSLTPLTDDDEERLLDRFLSVARATIKGTLVIGIVQGALGGIAFAVVGIQGAAFWATIMAVLSIIPAVGAALVWVPAVGYLLITNQIAAGIGLAIWCAAVVGTVDNLLRPRLVGSDTKMPDLLILVSTLGGIVLFGIAGFVIGPIVASLFLTVWSIYGAAFQKVLPQGHAAEAMSDSS